MYKYTHPDRPKPLPILYTPYTGYSVLHNLYSALCTLHYTLFRPPAPCSSCCALRPVAPRRCHRASQPGRTLH
ncbi:hypothetical protein B484DRAFT_459292 [Ochromonadaceae sp. CCMP2298]|nr:hypothetical protein B484DRAFT_459292 [Ochromonadaceae sp. CCMP2298]